MAINEVLGLTLDLEANTTKFMKDLRKAAGSVDLAFNPKPLIQSFARAQSGIQKVLAGTVADAASAGFSKANITGLVKRMAPLTQQIEASNKRIFELSVEMGRKGIEAEEKERLKALRKVEKQKLAGLTDQFNLEKKNTDRLMARRKKARTEAAALAAREFGKGAAKVEKAGEAFATSIESAFAKLKSGDFAGLLKGMGGGASKMGKSALSKAQEGGATSGLLKSIGGLLSKIGPALAAIGAIAAGIGAVVAIVISADSAIKGLNKTLLDSGAAGIDLANKYNVLGKTLTNISQHFSEAFTLKNTWGTTAKDHLEILGAFSAAGVTFKQMREEVHGVGTEMDRLQKYTVVALTYSKLLGMSTQEVSTQMATYMEELGYTLEGIQARFANITVATKESGFATKRFLNMLFQATSGMSMYNVRLEEAAGLLIQLGKILGQKMGGDFLQQLTKGFKDEGTQDRIRKTMTTGVGYSLKVLKMDAIKSSEEFKKKLDELGASNVNAQDALTSAMDAVLGESTAGMNAEQLVTKLSKLTNAEQAHLLAKAEASKSPAMVRMLDELMAKSTAFGGKGLASAQAARQSAGGAATLLLQLGEIKRIAKGKRLDEIDLDDMKMRMAAENITGKQGEEYLKLFKVGRRLSGHQAEISEAQAGIRAGTINFEEWNEKFGKEFGVVLDEKGKRFKAKMDASGELMMDASLYDKDVRQEMGDTFEDLVMTVGDELEGGEEKKVEEDIELAKEIAANTTDMAKVLEQGVEYFLSKIYSAVQWIASFFGDSLEKEEEVVKAKASQEMQESIDKLREQIRLQQREISTKQRAIRSGKLTAEEKAAAEKDIAERMGKMDVAKSRLAVESTQLRELERLTSQDEVEAYGSTERTASFKAAAGGKEAVHQAAAKEVKRLTGRDIEAEALSAKEKYEGAAIAREEAVQRGGMEYMVGLPGMGAVRAINTSNIREKGQQLQEKTFSEAVRGVLGTTMGYKEADLFDFATGMANISGSATEGMSSKEMFGDYFIDSDKKADEREKKSMTEEEKQKQEMTKKVIAGIDKIEKDKEVRELAAKMAQLGMPGTAETLTRQARGMIEQGRLPTGIDYKKGVVDPDTGMKRRLGDILMSTHKGSAAFSSAMFKRVGPTPEATPEAPAHDFLMQVGEGGRVKFAQRIDTADTVTAVASKPGGAISQAKGGRGSSVIVNSFGNSAEVVRGIQAAVSAGVL